MTNLSCRIGATLGVLFVLAFAGCGGGGTKKPGGGTDAGMDVHAMGDVLPDRVDAGAEVASDAASTGTDARSDVVSDRGGSDDARNDADGAGPADAGDPCATAHGGCDPLVTCTNVSGTATCGDCPSGYTGSGSTTCSDIDECATANGGCDPLATCMNTPGARVCSPCPNGYSGTGTTACTDIDECVAGTAACDPKVTCQNIPGSYTCGNCPAGYSGGGTTGCVDIDECATNNGGCDSLTTCTNTPGSRTCGACPAGYTGTGSTICVDIDECATGHGGCDPLVACINTPGSHTCGACPAGYSGTGATSCTDIDECATANGGCDLLTTCTNTPGSRTCSACPTGYSGTGATGCADIDECAVANGGCDPLATCTNTAGSYMCGACPAGYTGTGATGCTDIDECATNNGGCDLLTTCTNTGGSWTCGACPAGYSGTGTTGCVDVDECASNNGGCDLLTTCTNTVGSRTCGACPAGYSGTGATGCADVNECATSNGGCDLLTTCTNTVGSRTCGACPAGYTGTGATSCVDINECTTNNGGCDALTTCTNTGGSRTCGNCPAGYTGTGAAGCISITDCATNNGGCDALTTCTSAGGVLTCGACPAGYTGTGASGCVRNRTDCYQVLELGEGSGDGLYTIDPDGSGSSAPVQVYCDMTDGGWTEIFDQDTGISGAYLSAATWRAGVTNTAPNAGQWSILNRVAEFRNADQTFEFRLTFGQTQSNYMQWTQTGDPRTGIRGTVSNVVQSPGSQSGCGLFGGLANDGQSESAWDGDAGGCWWFAVGAATAFQGGIPAYYTSGAGMLVTDRARLYVRRRNLVPPVSSGLAASFNARNPGAVMRDGSNVVSQWTDGSGNAHDLTVSGTAPVFNSSLINQRAGLDFSGGKRLATAAFPLTAEVTVFAVAQWRTPATWGPIAHHGDRDTDWSLEQSGIDPGNVMHFQSNNDNFGVKLALTTNGNYVLTGRITGQTRYFSATSTAGGIITAAGTPVSIVPGSKILYVGSSNINEASNAYIGELLYYNRSLSDIERDQVIAYLRSAWGI